MGVCKVISERSVLYVFTLAGGTFDHPFGSSDRRSTPPWYPQLRQRLDDAGTLTKFRTFGIVLVFLLPVRILAARSYQVHSSRSILSSSLTSFRTSFFSC